MYILYYFVIILILGSCGRSKNYENAYVVTDKEQLFIKLTGKRSLKPNDPIDIIKGKTYNDSLFIPIPLLQDGIIKGEDIPVEKGRYPYKGEIIIEGNSIEVSLLIDNSDDKKLVPLSWNGKYELKNRD